MASETLLCIFSTRLLPVKPQGNDNLALPQRNGAEDRRLDLIHQHFVVVLDEADLRRCLDSDGLAQLQVVDLFFKAVYRVLEIPPTTWALMASPLAAASARSCGRVVSCNSCSFSSPAAM